METRKRLYKATNNTLTLTERVRKDKNRQVDSRKNKFNANRNINVDLDDSIKTPVKAMPVKISQIKDKPAKLKAYIEQKRTNKLKEQLEQRSPFIPFVPIGRWVEKKESVKKPKAFIISTPVKKALMSDGKILKKSTIKEIATTARKENIGTKKNKQDEPGKFRKKILGEFNNVPQNQTNTQKELKAELAVESAKSFNETFELIPSEDDIQKDLSIQSCEEIKTVENISFINLLTDDKSLQNDSGEVLLIPEKVKAPFPILTKKNVVTKQSVKVDKDLNQKTVISKEKKEIIKNQAVKIAVPVKRPNRQKTNENKLLEKLPVKKRENATKKKETKKSKSVQQEMLMFSVQPVESVIKESKPQSKPFSDTYLFYKSSLSNQSSYISIQLKSFTNDLDNFISKLPEETQSNVHQTIQQGHLLINEKFKSFEDILVKFENADPADQKRITSDDVENYWMLMYNEVQKFKDSLQYAQEAKIFAMKDERKRRTRRTLSETPSRRSRRIAESGDTPKHNPLTCFGCTPVSSSKANTPKSAKKRRATFKKSIAFDLASVV